ncbi:hypothetical protein AX17_006795 [Amanita inopinata Kibby_2008]|nr:hypothetical protein AX17_006795 [Amanita inopinata Kibby_2008]
MSTIIFYDIPSKLPDNLFGPNTQKTRFTLRYKGLPFKTEWIEFSDIEPKCKELGIAPTAKKPDGSPRYTVPAIYDPSTKKYIADSILIAEYLDEQYPNTPRLIPDGTKALQHAYNAAFATQFGPVLAIVLPAVIKVVNPPSEKFLRAVMEADGKTVEEKEPKGEERKAIWQTFKENMHVVDGWIQRNGGGVFLGGDKPIFADFEMAGFIFTIRAALGKDSELWKEFERFDEGRWGKFVEAVEKYQSYD